MTTPSFKTRYMFSVKAELDSYKLGETPAGSRVDIDYKCGTVKTDAKAYFQSWSDELRSLQTNGDIATKEVLARVNFDAPDPFRKDDDTKDIVESWLQRLRRATKPSDRPNNIDWFGLEGNLISGSDWLLVRTDGVAEMDGRITLQEEQWDEAGNPQGGGLINTQLSSVVDLYSVLDKDGRRIHRGPRPPGSAVYEAWKKSNVPAKLRFALALRFTAAEASQPWAAAEYRSLGGFWRNASLPLYEYTANVEADLDDGLIRSVELDIWRTSIQDGPLKIW